MIKIIVAGFSGRMGSTATKMVLDHENFELVGVLDPIATATNLQELPEYPGVDVPIFTKKEEILTVQPDVWIDFTIPAFSVEHTRFALENQIAPVVGTTGIDEASVADLIALSKEKKVGGLIAPNFAIGGVLMMQFAQQAAKYFPDVEIIELHHDKKLDAPSGTAIKTAEMISEIRQAKKQGHPDEIETIPGARGAEFEGMRIHSVRLPGLVAHQQVQFGAEGEGLTIRHDSYDRSSFMSGVALGCEKVVNLQELVYGLDQLL
ncbi:4-hydroxy-tetrahydrodipicolinate reductase [Enterococcus sp. PF1-24]|uniref:4-hydroxy-tetrahydrodipicolinate reductase n=1 Tax=unclassified Enterococcus TaxID=2608891 RepID=UPI002473C47A|nr:MULTISPECIES: 4-hydroxy-tetrahydrodipicolinate reductase [unclassified Enterococcus]MDH6365616.1 4-hydroxy-tetrahydrodipicolinate reductase [Enterococcus sp. PFB1-1]MDH6402718.1 4-hydroxy-tetrahydrodipicolinate reductase [Enterococcus sp. PF1-24]